MWIKNYENSLILLLRRVEQRNSFCRKEKAHKFLSLYICIYVYIHVYIVISFLSTINVPSSNFFFFFKIFHPRYFYYMVMDSYKIVIVDCCAIYINKATTLESQFLDHMSGKRCDLIIPIFQNIICLYYLFIFSLLSLPSYQILTGKDWSIKIYVENLLLLWMCVLHLCVMNILNKFFRTILCNRNQYMRFYSANQLLKYNHITIWVYNIRAYSRSLLGATITTILVSWVSRKNIFIRNG